MEPGNDTPEEVESEEGDKEDEPEELVGADVNKMEEADANDDEASETAGEPASAGGADELDVFNAAKALPGSVSPVCV